MQCGLLHPTDGGESVDGTDPNDSASNSVRSADGHAGKTGSKQSDGAGISRIFGEQLGDFSALQTMCVRTFGIRLPR